jgi:hypothetical protein
LNKKPIQFSKLRYEKTPIKGKGAKYPRIWVLEKSQATLKDFTRWAIYVVATTIVKLYKWFNKPRTIRIKKWKIIIGALLLWVLLPSHPGKIIYADPMAPVPHVAVVKIAKATKLPDTQLQTVEPVAYVYVAPVAAPAPVYIAPTGCSVWHSGDVTIDTLIDRESGGQTCVTNSIGCYGILQACPGEPLRRTCGGDGACQLKWFEDNKLGRYGSWAAALAHSYATGWW